MRHLEARGFQDSAKIAREFPGRVVGAAEFGRCAYTTIQVFRIQVSKIQVFKRPLVGLLGVGAMRMNAIAMLVAFPALVMVGNVTAATAAETKSDVKGLYLLTDYPAVSVRPGTTSTISLRLQNYGLAPENFALSVDGAPAGWTATLLGGRQPVGAAMPATHQGGSLPHRRDVAAEADLSSK